MEDSELALTITYSLLAVISLLLNGCLITLFIRKEKLRSSNSSKLLFSLIVADFVVSLGGVEKITDTIFKYSDKTVWIMMTYVLVSLIISLLCIIYVSVDRFVAIKYPLRYPTLIQGKHIKKMITAAWIVPVLLGGMVTVCILLYRNLQYDILKILAFFTFLVGFVGIIGLAVVNVVIYTQVHRQLQMMNDQLCGMQSSAQRMESRRREVRAAYLCFTMSATFAILWSPILIYSLGVSMENKALSQEWFVDTSTSLVIGNTIADPLLYVVINKKVKKAIQGIFRRPRAETLTSFSDVSYQTTSL